MALISFDFILKPAFDEKTILSKTRKVEYHGNVKRGKKTETNIEKLHSHVTARAAFMKTDKQLKNVSKNPCAVQLAIFPDAM